MIKYLPRRVKRIFACGTIFTHVLLKNKISQKDSYLSRLRSKLNLKCKLGAIKFVSPYSEIVWHTLPTPPLDEMKVERFVKEVMAKIPEHWRYARQDDMEKDLAEVLRLAYDIIEEKHDDTEDHSHA